MQSATWAQLIKQNSPRVIASQVLWPTDLLILLINEIYGFDLRVHRRTVNMWKDELFPTCVERVLWILIDRAIKLLRGNSSNFTVIDVWSQHTGERRRQWRWRENYAGKLSRRAINHAQISSDCRRAIGAHSRIVFFRRWRETAEY